MQLRFLPFVLMAACLPLVLAAVVTGELAYRTEQGLQERAIAASAALQSRLDGELAMRHELLLRLDAMDVVTASLKDSAERGEGPTPQAALRLREVIRKLVRGEPPELMAVVTAHGAMVVVTNGEPQAAGVTALPLAAAALAGQGSDAFADFADDFYRFAAIPVGMGEAAIVIGDRFLDAKALRLRDAARADVTFVRGNRTLLSSLPREWQHEVIPAASMGSSAYRSGALEIGLPAWLDPVAERFPVMVPREAYVSISRDLGGVFAVLTFNVKRELEWLAQLQLLAIALTAGLLLVGLAWMRVIYGPVARQVRSIEAHLARIKAERGARLGSRGFGGIFRRLARQVDETAASIDRQIAAAMAALPPGEATAATPPSGDAVTARQRLRPMEELPLQSSPEPAVDDHEEGTPAFPFGDDPAAQALRADLLGATAASAAPAAVLDGSAALAMSAPAEAEPEVSPLEPRPPETEPEPEPAPAASSAPGETSSDDESPEALLARSQALEEAELLGGFPPEPEEDAETRHFRDVFERFLAVRRECGEPADGLSFERFIVRLEKSRNQLVEKYGCSGVRFSVYVKEGKAAIKAAPER